MGSKIKDITGQKFNMLTVLESFRENGYRQTKCKCLCDCGNIKILLQNNIVRPKHHTKSCGCIVKARMIHRNKTIPNPNRKVPGYANSRQVYSHKKRDATHNNILFEITFEQFIEISSKNCYYCNVEPKQCNNYKRQNYGVYKYNGMDRVVPKEGYVYENIVPCCWSCNKAKSGLSQSDFYKIVENIYNNRIRNEKSSNNN